MQESGRNDVPFSETPAAAESRAGSAGRRIFHGVMELIELQARLVGLKILAAIQASFQRIGLLFLAVITALAGLVFLYLAVFQSLERILPTRYVFLIFAMFHFLLAGGLWLAAGRITDVGIRAKPHRNKAADGGADQ